MEEIRARARELYIPSMMTHPQLAALLSDEFVRQIDFELTKKWAQEEGWTEQRQQYFSAFVDDRDRVQTMKDIIYAAMLDGPTPTEMQKLSSAYAALMKIVVPPGKGGEKRPSDLLRT